jgi:hypothetical protein
VKFTPDQIIIQAASIAPDSGIIETLLGQALKMVHANESDIHISSVEPTFGWNFYVLTVRADVPRRLAQLPGSGLLRAKGNSLEQKFVNWLNRRVKVNNLEDKIHFSLVSDLKSSRYGLF